MSSLAAPYAPRQPTETPLYRLVRAGLQTFLRWARESYSKPVPRYVEQDLRGYLKCGVFRHGFLRAHCDACGHDLLVAFSCKGRGVCPSCAGRRMANTAAHLVDRVLPDVPLRQYVLSLPYELRRLAAFDPVVLRALARIFADAIFASHRRRARAAGFDQVASGAVTCVQRFGGSLNLNVHFHTIVMDGVFLREPDGSLGFVPLPMPTRAELQQLVTAVSRRAIAWLRRHGHLSEDPVDLDVEPSALDACVALAMQRPKVLKLAIDPGDDDDDDAAAPAMAHRAVEDTGFNLHAGVRVRDDLARERLCRYALRPALALSRLRLLRDGRVAYRVKQPRAGKAKHMILTPVELLARVAALVPPPRYPLVRYHGVLAPRLSWRKLVVPRPREPSAPSCGRPRPPRPLVPAKPGQPIERREHRDTTHAAERPDPVRRDPAGAASTTSAPPAGQLALPLPVPPPAPEPAAPAAAADLHVRRLAPNVVAVGHWERLRRGLLYAATSRIDWPRLLRRTFEIDVLQCPTCGGRLRPLAVITDDAAVVRILRALDLPAEAPAPARARDPTDLLDLAADDPPAA